MIRNQFGRLSDLLQVLRAEDVLRIASIYPRDATGKIIAQQNIVFNLVGSKYSSLTYEAGYRVNTNIGVIEPRPIVVQNLVAERRITDATGRIDRRGRIQGPDRYKLTGSLTWTYGDLTTTLFAYHTLLLPQRLCREHVWWRGFQSRKIKKVSAFTSFDLSVMYNVNSRLRMDLVSRNLLAAKPPFVVVDGVPYDTARYDVGPYPGVADALFVLNPRRQARRGRRHVFRAVPENWDPAATIRHATTSQVKGDE